MAEIPQPYHRWAANEDADVKAYSLKDRCLSCGVKRYDPMPGERAEMINAVAASPCPQKPWREMTNGEILQALAAYREDESK